MQQVQTNTVQVNTSEFQVVSTLTEKKPECANGVYACLYKNFCVKFLDYAVEIFPGIKGIKEYNGFVKFDAEGNGVILQKK
jgi:hypothetical protein